MDLLEALKGSAGSVGSVAESKSEVGSKPQEQPLEEDAEVFALAERAKPHVQALAEIYLELKALGRKPRLCQGLKSADPVRLAGALLRANFSHLAANAKAWALPVQGWEPKRGRE